MAEEWFDHVASCVLGGADLPWPQSITAVSSIAKVIDTTVGNYAVSSHLLLHIMGASGTVWWHHRTVNRMMTSPCKWGPGKALGVSLLDTALAWAVTLAVWQYNFGAGLCVWIHHPVLKLNSTLSHDIPCIPNCVLVLDLHFLSLLIPTGDDYSS